jgi:DNA-binding MarR family transcriptional regulator
MTVKEDEGGSAMPCLCSRVRRADRLLNRIYDDALRPTGLATTQYSLLAMLDAANGSMPHGQLATRQEMAGTTLSRTLKPLLRDGLVAIAPGADRRTRLVTITPRGQEALAQARPLWKSVQEGVIADVGESQTERLLEDLASLIAQLRDERGKEREHAR